ncbi:cardiolipin synthetase, putative [Plasmodium vivax]|uniref:Cardiolipin synthetase, putative n=1 Tax=Plasmodium vivax TaxID=5855 RepID=A0A564ZZW4_PLAVI|nr:cardiolipin synthetase, putative [Plasmodium vivax]
MSSRGCYILAEVGVEPPVQVSTRGGAKLVGGEATRGKATRVKATRMKDVGGKATKVKAVGGKAVGGKAAGGQTAGSAPAASIPAASIPAASPPRAAVLKAQRDLNGSACKTARKRVDPQGKGGTEGDHAGEEKKKKKTEQKREQKTEQKKEPKTGPKKPQQIDIEKLVEENVEQLPLDSREKEVIKNKWKYILKKNKEKYGKVSDGNKVKIYNDGHAAFRDILQSIEKSKKRVWLESYIFDDSELAKEVVDSLCNAARRGCDVILLIDYIGSMKIKNKWVNQLRESNVHVLFFNTFLSSFLNMFPILFRDHRKILIVDAAAYCGSMNVSESVVPSGVGWRSGGEAASEAVSEAVHAADATEGAVDEAVEVTEGASSSTAASPSTASSAASTGGGIMPGRCEHSEASQRKGSGNDSGNDSGGGNGKRLRYYDLHIKMKGPAVKDLADVFLDSLKMAKTSLTREPIEEQPRYEGEEGESCFVQVLESNVLRKVRSIQSTFDWVIKNGATKNIHITTSYFIPPGFLRRALFSALNNGVDISFLLSGNSDVLGDVPATYHIVKKFLRRYHKGGGGASGGGGSGESGGSSGSSGGSGGDEGASYLQSLRKRAESTIGENFRRRQHKGKSDFYFFQNRHCHAKNLVVDNLWCAVGSYNWDRFSSRRNLEVMVSIFNKKICDEFVHEHKSKIESDAKQVTLAHLVNRNAFQGFLSCCAYHLTKWSGKKILDGLSNDSKNAVLRKAVVNKYLSDTCVENISLNMMWGA